MSAPKPDSSNEVTFFKTATVKLYPNKTQEDFFPKVFGLCNAVYNLCLEQDRTFFGNKKLFRKNHHIFSTNRVFTLDDLHHNYMVRNPRYYGANKFRQDAELTQLKKEFPYFKVAPQSALQNSVTKYHRAKAKKFDDYREGKCKDTNLDYRKVHKNKSFEIPGSKFSLEINKKNETTGKILMPNLARYVADKQDEASPLSNGKKRRASKSLGMVKFRGLNLPKGAKIAKLVVKEEQDGTLYGFISYSVSEAKPIDRRNDDPVGIDRNVDNICVDSNGNIVESDKFFARDLPKIKEKQRKFARQKTAQEEREKKEKEEAKRLKKLGKETSVVKKRESNRRKKTRKELARLHLRVARKRKDSLHKTTTNIAKNHGTVVLEDLRIVNMTKSNKGTVENPGKNRAQKRGLNRAILDQGWGIMKEMLRYKLVYSGGILGLVPPQYTSQTCSMCFNISKKNRVDRDKFKCVSCGYEAHADHNASVNIKTRWGTADAEPGKLAFPVERDVFRVAEFST